jgi:hypothetical protein
LPEWPVAKKDAANPDVMIINTESKAEKAANDNRYIFSQRRCSLSLRANPAMHECRWSPTNGNI